MSTRKVVIHKSGLRKLGEIVFYTLTFPIWFPIMLFLGFYYTCPQIFHQIFSLSYTTRDCDIDMRRGKIYGIDCVSCKESMTIPQALEHLREHELAGNKVDFRTAYRIKDDYK